MTTFRLFSRWRAAILPVLVAGSAAGCFRPLALADAPTQIVPVRRGCSGDHLIVHLKNGTTRRDPRTKKEEFAACAVTKTYILPCCSDTKPDDFCPSAERVMFSDIASIERAPDSCGGSAMSLGGFSLGNMSLGKIL